MNIFAKVGPRDKPNPNPSICLHSLTLNIKKEFNTESSKRVLNKALVKSITVELGRMKSLSEILFIVSFKRNVGK